MSLRDAIEQEERERHSLTARLDSLERNKRSLAERVRLLEKWYDCINSAFHKRLLWWLMGYRFTRLGRWYRAPWNHDGSEYD